MPKYSLAQIDAAIKGRIKYFLQLKAYLAEIKAGKIADDEVRDFLYDHLYARVEASHGLVDKRENVLLALTNIATRKLAAYNAINKAFNHSNQEVAITATAVLVHYQLQYSQDDKHKSSFHDIEKRAMHIFHEHDIFKLLEQQVRFHVPKWFLKFWKSVYFSSDQRLTLDGDVGLSVRVAIDRQILGDEIIALMKTILEYSAVDEALNQTLLSIEYKTSSTSPVTNLLHHMQKVTSPAEIARKKQERKQSQRKMLKESQTNPLIGKSANPFELMDGVYQFVMGEVVVYHEGSADYEKLNNVLQIAKKNLLAANLSNQKAMQAYRAAVTQINADLEISGKMYSDVLPLVLQMEEKLEADDFERERVRLVAWVARYKSVGPAFDDNMFSGISAEEIANNHLAVQPLIDQLKTEIEQYQADARAHLSKYDTPAVMVDDQSCDSEESDDEAANIIDHTERTARWKKQVNDARVAKQQAAANRQDSASSSTSTSSVAPEANEAAIAMKKRIVALKPRYQQLICNILESSKSVKYNKLCALLPKLGAKLTENGGGSTHKTIEFNLHVVQIYSACSDTRKQEAEAVTRIKAKGGIFRQHRHGDYTPKLCPFNLHFLRELFEKVGITKELMLSITDRNPDERLSFIRD